MLPSSQCSPLRAYGQLDVFGCKGEGRQERLIHWTRHKWILHSSVIAHAPCSVKLLGCRDFFSRQREERAKQSCILAGRCPFFFAGNPKRKRRSAAPFFFCFLPFFFSKKRDFVCGKWEAAAGSSSDRRQRPTPTSFFCLCSQLSHIDSGRTANQKGRTAGLIPLVFDFRAQRPSHALHPTHAPSLLPGLRCRVPHGFHAVLVKLLAAHIQRAALLQDVAGDLASLSRSLSALSLLRWLQRPCRRWHQ